jgi:hypothetical protein
VALSLCLQWVKADARAIAIIGNRYECFPQVSSALRLTPDAGVIVITCPEMLLRSILPQRLYLRLTPEQPKFLIEF